MTPTEAWAVVRPDGSVEIDERTGGMAVYPTQEQAECRCCPVDRAVRVRIEEARE